MSNMSMEQGAATGKEHAAPTKRLGLWPSEASAFFMLAIFTALFFIALTSVLAQVSTSEEATSAFDLRANSFFGILPTLFANDVTGIVRLQAALLAAACLLAFMQISAGAVERRIAEGPSARLRTLDPIIFRLSGAPEGWASQLNSASRADDAALDEFADILEAHRSARIAPFRFAVAALPLLGFIGTVLGVRQAVEPLDRLDGGANLMGELQQVVSGLEIAFDTTLAGLAASLPAMVLQILVAGAVARSLGALRSRGVAP